MSSPQSQTLTVTVVPASTKAGEETIRALLALTSNLSSYSNNNNNNNNNNNKNDTNLNGLNLKINAIYRDPSKAPKEFTSLTEAKFSARRGNVGDLATLDFGNSDVVFYIPPPIYDGTDTEPWALTSAGNVKTALNNSPNADGKGGVKKLILFSAIGAQHASGIGILKLNHITDEILTAGDVQVKEKVVIKPGYFAEGFASFLEEARGTGGISSWLTPLDYQAPVVSVKDIASTCAQEILKAFSSDSGASFPPRYIKIFGPRHYSAQDLHGAISTVLDRKDITLNPVTPEHLAEYFGQVIPQQYVQEFVNMTTAVLPGGVMVGDFGYDDVDENTAVVRGETELLDAIRAVYQGLLGKEMEAGN